MTSAKIVLAAGGTGGHMFPAEALASELKRRGYTILLVTDARGDRYTASFPCDEKFLISAATPSIGGPVAKVIAATSIARGLFTTLSEFRKRRPDAAVGFGGYPSLPSMKAAQIMKIPYGVHEQNAVLGRSNRLLAGGAKFVAHAFPVLEKAPAGVALSEVGNPVRDAVAQLEGAPFASTDSKIGILIFGGSQGARIFSDAPVDAITKLPDGLRAKIEVTHQVQEEEIPRVKEVYEAAGVPATLAPFFSDLPALIAQNNLVIGRAGASTVTELSTIGRPSILVPLGIAMDDHQSGNARVLSDKGGAILIPEEKFSADSLETVLTTLVANPDRLGAMAQNSLGQVRANAAQSLADLVEGLLELRQAA